MGERISLEWLRYVRSVEETGSFSAAARLCGVTQPTLSTGVARLEQQLGDRLFHRSHRGVSTTPFGAALLPAIHRTLAGLDAVIAEARRWNGPATTSIRVGVSPVVNPALVARTYSVVSTAAAGEPRHLVLREANLAELREGLTAGDLDLIIVPSVGPLARYEHRVIDAEPLVLVESMPPASQTAPLADLAGAQLILMPDTCGLTTFIRDLLRDQGLPVRTYPGEAASYQVLEEWSRLGLGCALLPLSKLTDPDTAPRPLVDEEGLTVEIFYEVVWDPRSALAPELRELAERLVTPRP